METLYTEKKWCFCLEAEVLHLVLKGNNGDLIRMCIICEKMEVIGKWK